MIANVTRHQTACLHVTVSDDRGACPLVRQHSYCSVCLAVVLLFVLRSAPYSGPAERVVSTMPGADETKSHADEHDTYKGADRSSTAAVQVFCRIRPLGAGSDGSASGAPVMMRVAPNRRTVIAGPTGGAQRQFTYDGAFDQTTTQVKYWRQ